MHAHAREELLDGDRGQTQGLQHCHEASRRLRYLELPGMQMLQCRCIRAARKG